MTIRILPLAIVFISNFIFAQKVSVVETKKIPITPLVEAYYPRFSSDDSKIIFSSANYKGLYSYDLKSNLSSTISEKNGAGYNPLIIDEAILYRTFKLNNGKKFNSVESFEFKSGKREVLESNKRSLKLPTQLPRGEIVLVENSAQTKKNVTNFSLAKSNELTKAVYVENNNLYLVNGDETKLLNPLGEGVYVWESLSKDGSRILFSFGNKGAFVCDLEGNILTHIEGGHYPRFSPNREFISYMMDKDNGEIYTSSDLFVYSEKLEKSFQITNTKDKIEMFAEWSNDGDRLVYHTAKGDIFTTTLKYEN